MNSEVKCVMCYNMMQLEQQVMRRSLKTICEFAVYHKHSYSRPALHITKCTVPYTQLQQTCTPYNTVQCTTHTATADLHSIPHTQLQQTCTPYNKVQCTIHTATADLLHISLSYILSNQAQKPYR